MSMISVTVAISISTCVTSLQPYHVENGHYLCVPEGCGTALMPWIKCQRASLLIRTKGCWLTYLCSTFLPHQNWVSTKSRQAKVLESSSERSKNWKLLVGSLRWEFLENRCKAADLELKCPTAMEYQHLYCNVMSPKMMVDCWTKWWPNFKRTFICIYNGMLFWKDVTRNWYVS